MLRRAWRGVSLPQTATYCSTHSAPVLPAKDLVFDTSRPYTSAMAFDKNFAINVMYPLANAAYLAMNVPTPPLALPAGFAVAGLIQANAADAAVAMNAASPDHQRLANIMVAESSIFGLVGWNAATRTAIVAIRGTKTIWDWLADIDAAPIPYLPNLGAGFVHMGFQLVYEHIRASISSLLRTNCPGIQTIWVTGHSLGGALAVLGAFDIFKNASLGPVPQLYTFAGPRTGAPDFATSFNAVIPVCTGSSTSWMSFRKCPCLPSMSTLDKRRWCMAVSGRSTSPTPII